MPYCHHCRTKIDEVDVFCPECDRSLVGEDRRWQEFKLRESIDILRYRIDAYVAWATILVTVGLLIGGALLFSSYLEGLFGIAFVCFGVGFAASAKRNQRKSDTLWEQLGQFGPDTSRTAIRPGSG